MASIAELSKDLKHKCGFQIEVLADDTWNRSTVAIACDTNPPPMLAILVATEHLMTMFAMNFPEGFEKGLESLCQGARTNRTLMADGKRVQ